MKPDLLRPAGFWIRALAHLIDTAVLAVGSEVFELLPVGIVGSMLATVGFAMAYYGVGHARWGATAGKWAVGVRVVSDWPAGQGHGPVNGLQSALRFVSYALSYGLFFCGFLMVGFHPRKRGLHEALSGTRSIRVPAGLSSFFARRGR